MTPTHYPGWRILGFVLGFGNAIGIVVAFHLVLHGDETAIRTAGWIARGTTPSDPKFLTLVFCLSLTVIGALTSVKRPARGFLLLGAGYLASVLSVLVLFPFELGLLTRNGLAIGFGTLYTWLGVRQRAADRS